MDLPKLLLDATGCPEGMPVRRQCSTLTDIIAKHPGSLPVPTLSAVLKWFSRGSIPGDRLVQIVKAARAVGRDIDIRNY